MNTRNNLIVYGLEETEGENCKQKVIDFFKVKMEAPNDVSIVDSHHFGQGKTKPIRVKLDNVNDKGYIFKHTKNLKGKKNTLDKSYYVQNELPEWMQEQERWERQIFARNKRSVANKLTIQFKKNKLQGQSKPYTKSVTAPKYGDLLCMSQEERVMAQSMKLVHTREWREKYNYFIGYASQVKDLGHVRSIYKHLKLKHADATHVVMSYILAGNSPESRGYDDDGEYGAGRHILDWLELNNNTMVAMFIVRYHSDQNMGV